MNEGMGHPKKDHEYALIKAVVFVFFICPAISVIHFTSLKQLFNQEVLSHFSEEAGFLAPLIFVLVYAVGVCLFVPGTLFQCATQRRFDGVAKYRELVLFSVEKRMAGSLGPHNYRDGTVFGHCAVIKYARGLLGSDHDNRCNRVDTRSRMGCFETALYRHRTGCCAGRFVGELF
jgi:hypothetical protein